jgi:hypothetical protein
LLSFNLARPTFWFKLRHCTGGIGSGLKSSDHTPDDSDLIPAGSSALSFMKFHRTLDDKVATAKVLTIDAAHVILLLTSISLSLVN